MALSGCHNATDFARAASRRLPRPLFDYIEGGADDEVTVHDNSAGFGRYRLIPTMMRDVRNIDLRRTVLGMQLDWPLILAPTGMSRMFHPDGERGVAAAAAETGVAYSLSTMGSESIEAIGAVLGPKVYQLYLLADDDLNVAALERAKAAGFDAVCLTVDTMVAGNRERDLRSGLTIPPRLGIGSILQFLLRPAWCIDYLRGGRFSLPNIAPPGSAATDISTLTSFFANKMERHISWDRVEKLIRHWNGPFAIKGLQTVSDTLRARQAGASTVIISNHGGRQLDGSAATIDLVADIADATAGEIEIVLDGGVRRGTDIVKALAMGADACMMGRPYVHALGSYGRPGVARLLRNLKGELERALALLGVSNLNELGRDHLRLANQLPAFLNRPEEALALPALKWSRR